MTALESIHRHPGSDDEPTGDPRRPPVVVIGAGPAGLTAALELTRRGSSPLVLEADDVVGGISRTVERNGWRFDIGGHRFFTKVPEVEALWRELLSGDDLLVRPRMSRIFYGGKFFDYPLRATNALGNLGIVESVRCVASYGWARLRRPKDLDSFEGWVSSRFGRRLYRTFFKTYTEKVWGVPATELRADWAAQRIKNLSLGRAVINSLKPRRKQTDVVSLIEQFLYPRFGPGMMWTTCRDEVVASGGTVLMNAPVTSIEHAGGVATAVVTADGTRHACSHVISSMPIGHLVEAMSPSPEPEILEAARALRHRDFLTVALVVPEDAAFPDNWIYIHSPDVRLGRVQNFGTWSPWMVKPGWTCLGLEYFVNIGDDLWSMSDEELIEFAADELASIGLVTRDLIGEGHVVRVPRAYPVYDEAYTDNLLVLRTWLAEHAENVHAVGRNGMHRYNNQDHSMLTAMLAVENIADGTRHDLWSVNVDDEYHEESDTSRTGASHGSSGRDAPVFAAAGSARSTA